MMVTVALPEHLPSPRDGCVTFWIIYEFPSDFPDGYVLRAQWQCGQETLVSRIAWYGRDADELRAILPPGCVNLSRMPGDDAAILEVWIA